VSKQVDERVHVLPSLDEALFSCQSHGVGPIRGLQLAQNAGNMVLVRLLGEVKLCADGSVAGPDGEEIEYLALPLC
jgi:hypothetical protein